MEAVSGGIYSPASGAVRRVDCRRHRLRDGRGDAGELFDPFFTTKFAGRGLGCPRCWASSAGMAAAFVWKADRVSARGSPCCCRPRRRLPTVATDTPPPAQSPLTPPTEIPSLAARRVRRSGPIPVPPLRSVPHPLPSESQPKIATMISNRPGSRGLAIVADDEPTVRQVGELMLKQLGFEVLTATNGEEAVTRFQDNADRVKLVLLDLMMPVMDGPEALAVIREHSAVPVILCSGYTSEAVPAELAGDAITGFLQKPYARTELQRRSRPSASERLVAFNPT